MISVKTLVFWIILFLYNISISSSLWSTNGGGNGMFRSRQWPLQPIIVDNLAYSVQLALEHCQQQFKWDRWNCPENVFSKITNSNPTKELSYVSAIASAAVVHVVTKNCSAGNLETCGCNPDLNGQSESDWIWGGCSDNIAYGENISKRFLDLSEVGIDSQTYVNLHNYEAGREAVRKTIKKHCKCHGVSGSCTVKSCWLQVASFESIASYLRQRYDRGVRVDFEDGKGKVVIGNSVNGNRLEEIPKANVAELVYLQESPNYCVANNTTGWTGTRGRTCSRARGENVSAVERRSCRNLCRKCGYEVRKKRRTVVRHCNCSFQWCCEVKCDTCVETVVEKFCA